MPENKNPVLSEMEKIKRQIGQRLASPEGHAIAHNIEQLVFGIVKSEALALSPDFLDPFVGGLIDRLQPTVQKMIDDAINRAFAEQLTTAVNAAVARAVSMPPPASLPPMR